MRLDDQFQSCMYAAEIEKQACTEYGPDRGNLKFAVVKLPWVVQEYNARRQAFFDSVYRAHLQLIGVLRRSYLEDLQKLLFDIRTKVNIVLPQPSFWTVRDKNASLPLRSREMQSRSKTFIPFTKNNVLGYRFTVIRSLTCERRRSQVSNL